MRIKVKIFSTLRQCVPAYDPEQGLSVELPTGSRLEDLLAHLKIPGSKAAVASCNGRILKSADLLEPESLVHLFQPVAGG
jgi:sulfur carrier protein ThiS